MKLNHPVKASISTDFGAEGSHWSYKFVPSLGWGRFHTGVDYSVSNKPVHAAGPGAVVFVGSGGPYGTRVDIAHGSGLTTRYAHLSSTKVRRGQSVSRGQVIGISGATGNVTGAHLHFETLLFGSWVDPKKYLNGFTAEPPRVEKPGRGLGDLDVTSGATWQRVGLFVGGAALVGVAGYFLATGRR